MNTIRLGGTWQVRLKDGSTHQASLPATLDENHIGYPDTGSNQWHPDEALGNTDDLHGGDRILTRLTRTACYEGSAWYNADPFRERKAGASRIRNG